MKRRILPLLMALVTLLALMPTIGQAQQTISYFGPWSANLDPDSFAEKLVEKGTGYDIEVRKVDINNAQATQLMIATDMPDCGWFGQSFEFMEDQEMIRRIPVDMVREHVPAYMELVDRYPLVNDIALDPEDPTQFRFLPGMKVLDANIYMKCIFIRYDWVEKLGLDLGDIQVEKLSDQLYIADKGIKLEDFDKVLRAFVNDDPDGNGKKDTFGILKDWHEWMLPTQGVIDGINEADGKATEWFTHPKTREMLKYVQQAYKDGLIYPEIFTIAWGGDWELINSGRSGVLGGAAVSPIWLNSWASTRPPLSLFAANPDAKLLMLPGIADETGHTYRARMLTPATNASFFVNYDVSDEKLVDVLKFFNFINFSDKQTQAELWYGEENVDWKWENDKPVKLGAIQPGEKGTQVFCVNIQDGLAAEWITYEPLFESGVKYYVESEGGIWNEDLIYPYKNDINSTTKAKEISNEYRKDWESVYKAYFMEVITGAKNLEGDWDTYLKDLEDVEYGRYLEEIEKAPKVEDLLAKYDK